MPMHNHRIETDWTSDRLFTTDQAPHVTSSFLDSFCEVFSGFPNC